MTQGGSFLNFPAGIASVEDGAIRPGGKSSTSPANAAPHDNSAAPATIDALSRDLNSMCFLLPNCFCWGPATILQPLLFSAANSG